jgi:hypothetical protein
MRVSQHLAKRFTRGELDPRLAAVAGWLSAAKAQANNIIHGQKQALVFGGKKAKIDYGRPGLGKIKWARRRTAAARRKDITKTVQPEAFNIPDLVLDLDAVDSPYVRVYGTKRNESGVLKWRNDDRRQKRIWNLDPKLDALVERIGAFKHELLDSEERWYAPVKPFDPRRISSRDILQVALLGPRLKSEESQKSIGGGDPAPEASGGPAKVIGMADVLRENGIPDRVFDNDIKTLRFMFAWQKTHPLGQQPDSTTHSDSGQPLGPEQSLDTEQSLDSKQSLDSEQEPIPEQHATPTAAPWPGLAYFRRSVASLLERESGEEFVSFWNDLREGGEKTPWSLQTIETGFQNFQNGLEKREDPTEALSFLSNMASNLRARNSHLPEPFSRIAIEIAFNTGNLSAVPAFLPGNEWAGPVPVEACYRLLQEPGTTAEKRLELFTFLTGHGLSKGLPYRPSARPSISEDSPHLDFETYVELLGRLGAVRTLWHEWHDPKYPNKDNKLLEKCFCALLHYEDLRDCQKQPGTVIAPVTGDMAEDMYLDARDIASFTSFPVFKEYDLSGYDFSGFQDKLREDCMRAMDLEDIEQAMDTLGKLLLVKQKKWVATKRI